MDIDVTTRSAWSVEQLNSYEIVFDSQGRKLIMFVCLFYCDSCSDLAATARGFTQFPFETDSQKTRELCFIGYQRNNYKTVCKVAESPGSVIEFLLQQTNKSAMSIIAT